MPQIRTIAGKYMGDKEAQKIAKKAVTTSATGFDVNIYLHVFISPLCIFTRVYRRYA